MEYAIYFCVILATQLSSTVQQAGVLDHSDMGYRTVDIKIEGQELMFNTFISGILLPEVEERPFAVTVHDAWPYRAIRYRRRITKNTSLDLTLTVRTGTEIWMSRPSHLCKMSKDISTLGMPNLVMELLGLGDDCIGRPKNLAPLVDLNKWILRRVIPVRRNFNLSNIEIGLLLTHDNGVGYTQYIYNGTLHIDPVSPWRTNREE